MNHLELINITNTLRSNHLSPAGAAILAGLVDGPKRIGDVARMMDITPAGITGTVDRLERQGRVLRYREPGDRRVIFLKLLPAGLELIRPLLSENGH